MPAMADPATVAQDLRSSLDREWYHTLELAPGVVTPGWFDTRKIVDDLPFPATLEGMRCLDIGTFDGFWSFEMERRNAAEVIAIDILDPEAWDWPVNSTDQVVAALERRKEGGRGFEIARLALNSGVVRRESSVYELSREEFGEFDFVYVGSLFMHLRDPVRALERIRDVCRGRLLVVDNINLFLTLLLPRRPIAALDGRGRPWWWKLNLAGLVRLIEVGGFRPVAPPRRIYMPPGPGYPQQRWGRSLIKHEGARERMIARLKGDPHAAVLAEPVGRP